MISKLPVITDGCKFRNSKETDSNNKYTTHLGSHFSLGLIAQPKLFVFVISRILAEVFSLRDNRLIRISAEFYSSHSYFFKIADWGSKPNNFSFSIPNSVAIF